MNSFLADGGDGFSVFTQCTQPLGGEVDLDAAVRYFMDNSPIGLPSLESDHAAARKPRRVGAASAAPTYFSLCSVEAVETSRIRDGFRAGLPLALAPLLFGASFGLLAVEAGMGWAGAIVMSATTFAGSAQFAAASILDDGGGALAAIVAAILLNARYVPLSLAVASIFPGSRRRRLLESQLIVDESWALSGRSGRFDYAILVGVGILLYVLWVGGTALGTVVGDLLDPEAIGLDAAFPALFLALLAPYLRTRRALATALVAGVITLVLLPVAPPGVPIVAASFAALIGLQTMTWIVIAVVGAVTMASSRRPGRCCSAGASCRRASRRSSRCSRPRCSPRSSSPRRSAATVRS